MKTTKLFLSLASSLVLAVAAHAAAVVGETAPDFTLTDSSGKSVSLASFRGQTVVLEWVNHGCPFVIKHYGSGNMQSTQKTAAADGAVWLSICSSAEGKQGYFAAGEWSKVNAEKNSAAKAVLLDADGTVGRLYGAKTTPQMFIINPAGQIVYAGAIDSIKSANADDIAKATNYVLAALADLKAGRPVAVATTQSYGCSVKYRD